MFKCINPHHTDTNASMKLLADLSEEQVWCYGCASTGDIFTVSHWLDNAPSNGIEFINNNIFKLAKQFNIQHDDIQLSPEQIEKLEWYRFTSIVVDRLKLRDERGDPVNWTHKHCESRGWSAKTCDKLGVATVESYNKLVTQLQTITGYTIDEIKQKGVTPDLFGPDLITITLYDERGRPIGFSARNLKWTKEGNLQKYKNSSFSPIFQKSSMLYGMHLVRGFKTRRLDIFEGNGSFIVAYGAGHNSCVAICGSALTEDQVALIKHLQFNHINLILDNDETGRLKTDEYMQKLAGIEGLKVDCTTLEFKPEDLAKTPGLKDPEDFIKLYGLGSFFKLKTKSSFDWYVDKEADDVKKGLIEPIQFANKMAKIIFNTENRIERGRQRQRISEITGVPERDIEAEMERQTRKSVSDIKGVLSKKILSANSADEIQVLIDDASVRLSDTVSSRETASMLSVEESVESFNDLVTILETKKPGLQGWRTGFTKFDSKVSGIPKPIGYDQNGKTIPVAGTLIGFPGAPQHGKSTIIQNIAINLAKFNEDCSVAFWCLDDSRQRVMERMLAMMSGISWRKITRREAILPDEKKLLDQHIDEMRHLITDGKITFKDHGCGSSIPILIKWVEMLQDKYSRPVVAFIDSFHKIHPADSDGNLTEYSKTKKFCEKLKSFAQTHHVTMVASLEMTKSQQRGVEPEMLNMADARKMEYDFDIIGTVYNNYYDLDGQGDQFLSRNGRVYPFIKLNIRKSKDGGSGPIYFALNQENFQLEDYSINDVTNLTGLTTVKSNTVGNVTISPPDMGNLVQKDKQQWAQVNTVTGEVKEPWND